MEINAWIYVQLCECVCVCVPEYLYVCTCACLAGVTHAPCGLTAHTTNCWAHWLQRPTTSSSAKVKVVLDELGSLGRLVPGKSSLVQKSYIHIRVHLIQPPITHSEVGTKTPGGVAQLHKNVGRFLLC